MEARPSAEMTLDEWGEMPEDDPGELVDGLLVEEEVPDCLHEVIVAWFVVAFRTWLGPGRGVVMGSEAKFAIRARRGRKPDVTVYLPGSRKPPAHGVIAVPPDIAIEVVSQRPRDGRRDRVEKVADYADLGVRWYWLLDPALRSLEILELGADGRYAHALGATDQRVSAVPGCEGFVVDLPAVWQEVERICDESAP